MQKDQTPIEKTLVEATRASSLDSSEGLDRGVHFKTVGRVRTAHGIHGEVAVATGSGEISWLSALKKKAKKEKVQVRIGEKAFVFAGAREHKEGLLLSLEGVVDRTQAEGFRGLLFALPEDLLTSKKGETIYLWEILQFMVLDGDLQVGSISGFSSNGAQDLLLVENPQDKGRPIEIPFVADFIKRIDFKGKKVLMDLPPGLIEINQKEPSHAGVSSSNGSR